VLPYEAMKRINAHHPDLDTVFQKFRISTIKANKPFPLDYIMQLPKMVTTKIMQLTREKLKREMEKKL